MFGLECRVTNKLSPFERRAVESLLAKSGLRWEGSPRYTALIEDGDENLAATASLDGCVIKMTAADEKWREAGLSATVISALMRTAAEHGIYHLFLYTKPETSVKFESLGFRLIAESPRAVLMECGTPGAAQYRDFLEKNKAVVCGTAGAAVMNCNPFTLGHLYLIEQAAAQCGVFYVIAVEEDASVFPFADRIDLIKRGTAHLANVRVLPSGSYAVSSATFPTYFLKDKAELSAAKVQAELDAALFGALYVPGLGLSRRFVGTEPLCRVTCVYNEALKNILPRYGCEITEIARKEAGGAPISASRVRAALVSGSAEELALLLPPVTLEYIKSPQGQSVIKKLREKHDSA